MYCTCKYVHTVDALLNDDVLKLYDVRVVGAKILFQFVESSICVDLKHPVYYFQR